MSTHDLISVRVESDASARRVVEWMVEWTRSRVLLSRATPSEKGVKRVEKALRLLHKFQADYEGPARAGFTEAVADQEKYLQGMLVFVKSPGNKRARRNFHYAEAGSAMTALLKCVGVAYPATAAVSLLWFTGYRDLADTADVLDPNACRSPIPGKDPRDPMESEARKRWRDYEEREETRREAGCATGLGLAGARISNAAEDKLLRLLADVEAKHRLGDTQG